MNRRLSVLTGALALALTVPQTAITMASATTEQAVATREPGAGAERDPDAENALARLRADASGKLRVHRAADGVVDFVSSTDGDAMVEDTGAGGPSRTAAEQLARYGEAFGIDGDTSRAVVKRSFASATGGSIVRAQQVVDGVPVFGGQVVMSLDEDQGVVSVGAATTEGTEVPAPVVSEARAGLNALAVTAKSHRVPAAGLTVTAQGRRLYDPAIVHTTDLLGVRPVWEFEVTDGAEIRETVLVGTGRGEVALHFNDAPGLDRVVCDNNGVAAISRDTAVPPCTSPARVEGAGPSVVNDVNEAYDHLGATSETYLELAGKDLTDIIGTGTPKKLMATVRWCFTPDADPDSEFVGCPFENAFWDGTQMVFGTGYAAADDVVAHELTHGYVQHTSELFMIHQSGALNESLADVVGEVVDHRYNPSGPPEDNSAWDLGEDVPGGAVRNLKDPTLRGQPDRMTSPNYFNKDVYYDAGAVHDNNGVGNKTAYLISQGGTFNGRTVTGIDGNDDSLAKTGLLYLEVIPRLTSGAQYADLGRVLATTCDELAADSIGGFVPADCASVRLAAAATELALPPADPTAAAREAQLACEAGTRISVMRRDDDDAATLGLAPGALWQHTPQNGSPNYARSGATSWFGWNPDPTVDGISASDLRSGSFAVPASQSTFLHFDHAYVFEWYDAAGGFPAYYPDGGQVLVQTLSGSTWTTRSVPWDNGPNRLLGETTAKVFGGDSHGYGSSRINLTSLAGQTVRIVFKVLGDEDVHEAGWWLDDLRLYTCPNSVASVPRTTAVAGTSTVKISWTAPAYVGTSPITGYRVTRSDGRVTTVPATARTTTLGALNPNAALAVSVAAVNALGQVGASGKVRIDPTVTTVSAPVKVRKGQLFTVTGKVVKRGTTTAVSGMPVLLQRRLTTSPGWSNVVTGTTDWRGIRSWSVRQQKATYYRVVARGARTYFWSTSAARLVKRR